jgi:DNA polymerase-1
MLALKIDKVTATALYEGFEASFPKLKAYAKMIEHSMHKKGFCKNTFGRKYYLSDPSQFYCIANYMIQGNCAYDLKMKMVRIDEYLRTSGAKTRMVLCVHDEIIFSKVDGEERHINHCVDIMEDSSMLNVPLVSEKETTDTFWSEKKPA